MTSRRDFLRNSVAATAGVGIASQFSSPLFASSVLGANDKVNIGLIGCNSHGFRVLQKHLNIDNVECIALCDVDANVLEKKSKEVIDIQGKKPNVYSDYRKFLENKDIDAVIIGTPDHWHCLPFVDSLAAGKDVYVEKPIANSIEECNIMRRATKYYNKQIVQVGQQQNSGRHWNEIMELMQSGKIGQIRKVKIWANFNYGVGRDKQADAPVPEGVDFDFWLGPAKERTFNPHRFHGGWRMFWDYGGGLMTDWGVHLIDMALWCKNVTTVPKMVASFGGNWSHPDNAHETPDTLSVNYQMDDFCLTWDHTAGTQNGPYDRLFGLAFIGNDGTLVVDRSGWQIYPEWDKKAEAWRIEEVPLQKSDGEAHQEHAQNFIECIKDRKTPNCDIDKGWLAAIYAHIGNLSQRVGRPLSYDEEKNIFTGDPEATALITPDYRAPWVLPKI